MREEINRLAERGAPDVASLVQFDEPLRWPIRAPDLVHDFGSGRLLDIQSESADALAVVCWLYRDNLIARLEKEIDEIADDKTALSPDQRAKKLAEIAAEILATERAEVHWSRAAGITIRSDCDPRAVLGVK